MMKRRELGSTLLELIASLLLLSAVGVVTYVALRGATKLFQSSRNVASETYAMAQVRHYMSRIFANSDTYRLDVPPRVFKNGQVTFHDGRPHFISTLRTASAPSASSDIVSSLRLHAGVALSTDRPRSGAAFTAPGCLNREPPWDSGSGPVAFVGVGILGISYWEGRFDRRRGTLCGDVSVSRSASLHIPAAAPEPDAALLLPVETEEAIYVDASGQLRYVAFAGNTVRENQPVAGGLISLALIISTDVHVGHTFYRGDLRLLPRGGQARTVSFHSALARSTHWNTLFWR